MMNLRSTSALVATIFLSTPILVAQDDPTFLRESVFGELEYRSLGPSNFGGRIVDIAVHPQRPSTFWIASATGGIWKTKNAGTTWKVQFDDQPAFSIGDIAVAPSNPDVLYVGTGEANNQRSSYWGNGLYRSDDGGDSWSWIGLDGTDHIGRVVVHPTDENTVWVAALGALYTSNDDRGIYKTSDGGKSWKQVQFVDADTGFVDLAIDATDPDVLYAASYERRRRAWHFYDSGTNSAIWKSTNGGDSWKKLRGGLPRGAIGRIGLATSAKNAGVVWAIVENANPAPQRRRTPRASGDPTDASARRDRRAPEAIKATTKPTGDDPSKKAAEPNKKDAEPIAGYARLDRELYPFGDSEAGELPDQPRRRAIGGEVYRSDDAGKSWTKVNSRPVGGAPHYYYGQIRVDPNDDDTVYVLGVNVYSTKDGGKSWRSRNGFGRGLHVDHHALWIDPNDSRHALLGNDGGISQTWDAGANWDYINDLPLAQFYAVGVDNRQPYTVYGGTQDNGSWGIPSRSVTNQRLTKQNAFKVGGGDGFYVCVDPSDDDILYVESQFGAIRRVNLRTGASASIRPKVERGNPALRFNWMAPIVVSSHNPSTVYFGSQHVHRSRNRGDDWTTISPDLTTADEEKIAGNVPHCTVTTLAESPRVEGRLVAGTDDGRVWLTKNGGQRWTDLTDRFPSDVQNLWVSRVECSHEDADRFWVAFTGYREDVRAPFLFQTTDGGETFRSIAHNLPSHGSVNVVREHPRNPDVLFVGTEFGVFTSIDAGGTWHPLGSDLPTAPVHDLVVHPREMDLVVATHSRGFYVLDIAAFEELRAADLRAPLVVFPPRDGHMTTQRFASLRYPAALGWRADASTQRPTFSYYLSQDADERVQIEVLDVTGEQMFSRRGSDKAGLHTLAWQTRGRRGGGGNRQNRRSRIPTPGSYLLRVTLGERVFERPFELHAPAGMSADARATWEALLLEEAADEEATDGDDGERGDGRDRDRDHD